MQSTLLTLLIPSFKRAEWRDFPSELGNLINLIGLDLGHNPLGGGFPPELGNLSNLQNLDPANDQLSGSIPPELGNLSNLRYLIFK